MGFAAMKASDKSYSAKHHEFDWEEAEAKAGVRFDPSGVRKAKELLVEVRRYNEQSDSTEFYNAVGKTGVVGKNLVFRIKSGGKHWGKVDVVLVPEFVKATADVKKTVLGLGKGQLTITPGRNPLTVTWWKATLGAVPDRHGVGDAIGKVEIVVASLKAGRSGERLDQLQSAVNELVRAFDKVKQDFKAKDDQKVIAKLGAAITGATAALGGDLSTHNLALAKGREQLAEEIRGMVESTVKNGRRLLQRAESELSRGDADAAIAKLNEVRGEVAVTRRNLLDERILAIRGIVANKVKAWAEDIPLDLATRLASKGSEAIDALMESVDALEDQARQTLGESPRSGAKSSEKSTGGTGAHVLDAQDTRRLSRSLLDLADARTAVDGALTKAASLRDGWGVATIDSKSMDAWVEQAVKLLDDVREERERMRQFIDQLEGQGAYPSDQQKLLTTQRKKIDAAAQAILDMADARLGALTKFQSEREGIFREWLTYGEGAMAQIEADIAFAELSLMQVQGGAAQALKEARDAWSSANGRFKKVSEEKRGESKVWLLLPSVAKWLKPDEQKRAATVGDFLSPKGQTVGRLADLLRDIDAAAKG